MMMMMTMIRNRDTVAATPLNNSSLPVLSKNISMGAPFTLPPSVFHSPPHLLFRSFSPPLFLIRPRSFASLRSSSPSRKTGKIGTFPRRKLFQKASKLALKAKGERERDEKKEKWARRIRRRGTKVERGEGNRCVVERDIFFFFFPFRPAFVSPESTRQVARPPLLPVSLATSDEKRQRFLLVLRSTCSSSPPSQIKR